MPKKRTSRAKGTYHYAKRADGTKYRVYHSGHRGKGSYGHYKKRTPYKRSRKARSTAGTITGYGAYKLHGRGLNPGTQVPKVKNSKGGCCVQHKEYIGDVPASVAFVVAALPINPGQRSTFPWLSQLAENFEEWKPKGIVFFFKSTSSSSVVSTNAVANLGTVIMGTEYNVNNPVFGNKQQMENYEGAVSTPPSKNMIHTIECSKKQNPLGIYYVRSGDVPDGADQRFYDIGTFQIASVGMQANAQNIGELWVSYDIELIKPRILTGQPGANNVAADHFDLGAGANQTGLATDLTTALPARPFGTSVTRLMKPTLNSTLGGRLSGGIVPIANQTFDFLIPVLDGSGIPTGAQGDSVANAYYFPPGVNSGIYMIQYNAKYGTASTAANPLVAGINCQLVGLLNNDATTGINNDTSANTTTICTTFFLQVTNYYAAFQLAGTAGLTNPTWVDLIVTNLPQGIN